MTSFTDPESRALERNRFPFVREDGIALTCLAVPQSITRGLVLERSNVQLLFCRGFAFVVAAIVFDVQKVTSLE